MSSCLRNIASKESLRRTAISLGSAIILELSASRDSLRSCPRCEISVSRSIGSINESLCSRLRRLTVSDSIDRRSSIRLLLSPAIFRLSFWIASNCSLMEDCWSLVVVIVSIYHSSHSDGNLFVNSPKNHVEANNNLGSIFPQSLLDRSNFSFLSYTPQSCLYNLSFRVTFRSQLP